MVTTVPASRRLSVITRRTGSLWPRTRRCSASNQAGAGPPTVSSPWDNIQGKIKWSLPEQFSVWSGALATAGDVVFYGTLEGYLKAVDAKTGKELYRFKTASGVIGNVMTYQHKGKQHIAVLSGVGGWAGIGLAAGLTDPNAGLGAVGGYAGLSQYTNLGGQLTVFTLPN